MNQYKGIRTGVIGVGSMGQNHARIYSEISNLVYVSDLDESQGIKVAEKLGTKYVTDYAKMLEHVDAVSIAVPTNSHKDVAERVAASGVHMLVEKPLALNSSDATKIVKVAEDAKVILSVGHIERYNPSVKFLKSGILNKRWGKVITISSKRVSKFPDRIKDVGVVLDLGIHDLDIIRYLADSEIKSVYSVGGSLEYSDKEDHALIIMEFENGIKSHSEVNWLTPMKVRQLTITCEKAYIAVDLIEQSVEILSSEYTNLDDSNLYRIQQKIKREVPHFTKSEPLLLEIEDFLECVQTLKDDSSASPLVSGYDGIEIIKIAESVLDNLEL